MLAQAPETGGLVYLTAASFITSATPGATRAQWGQLVPNAVPGPLLAAFLYDGLGRLIQTYRQDRNDGGEVEAYYYDGVRRIRETTSQSRIREYVWGPGYVDEILCQYRYLPAAPEAGLNAAGLENCDAAVPANAELDGGTLPDLGDEPPPAAGGTPPGGDGGTLPGGGGSQPAGWAGPVYYLQDANYNVVALVRPNVSPRAENVWLQYQYEPYGTTVAADVSASAPADLVNRIGHQGLFFERFCVWATDSVYDRALQPDDPATAHRAVGLYYNRNRWYSPELGRLVQRDLAGTGAPSLGSASLGVALTNSLASCDWSDMGMDGISVYAYERSNRTRSLDATGLFSIIELSGAASFSEDIDKSNIDIGLSLVGAMKGLAEFIGDRNLELEDFAANATNETIDDTLTSLQTTQRIRTAILAAGAVWVGGQMAANFAQAGISAGCKMVRIGGGEGFLSFSALTRYMGSPRAGKVWHHIVEQCKVKKFTVTWIQNTKNVVAVSGCTNIDLNRFDSSVREDITGSTTMTVRAWLEQKSFQFNSDFGRRAINNVQEGLWP